MRPSVKWMLVINLGVATVLTFVFADLMVSPGRLIDGHRALETDCFACHRVFLGASADKCISCHKIADIGRLTVDGAPVAGKRELTPFHKKLTEPNCASCHTDHAAMTVYRAVNPFHHRLIVGASRDQCATCHITPADPLHRAVSEKCADCHKVENWKPATFKHGVVAAAELENCGVCHKTKLPKDKLHRAVSDKCGRCHTVENWKRTCSGFCGYKLETPGETSGGK